METLFPWWNRGCIYLPEYRYYRCASNMLIKSVEIMKDRGYAFSALAPFS